MTRVTVDGKSSGAHRVRRKRAINDSGEALHNARASRCRRGRTPQAPVRVRSRPRAQRRDGALAATLGLLETFTMQAVPKDGEHWR